MLIYEEFQELFNRYDEKRKKEILGNIFKIKDVSVYSIVERGDKIIFRLYARGVFYQFVFVGDGLGGRSSIRVDSSSRLVVHRIYMGSDFWFDRERLLFLLDGVPIF